MISELIWVIVGWLVYVPFFMMLARSSLYYNILKHKIPYKIVVMYMEQSQSSLKNVFSDVAEEEKFRLIVEKSIKSLLVDRLAHSVIPIILVIGFIIRMILYPEIDIHDISFFLIALMMLISWRWAWRFGHDLRDIEMVE